MKKQSMYLNETYSVLSNKPSAEKSDADIFKLSPSLLNYKTNKLPNLNFKGKPEALNNLMPWSEKLPEECKQQKK